MPDISIIFKSGRRVRARSIAVKPPLPDIAYSITQMAIAAQDGGDEGDLKEAKIWLGLSFETIGRDQT